MSGSTRLGLDSLDPERWERIKSIFHAAIERPAAEVASFLDQACEGDPGLRAQVKELLAADSEAGAFLPTQGPSTADAGPHSGGAPAPSLSVRIGTRVGPYRIVREVGRGGMGVVCEAERADGQFRQRVALKLIKRGMDTDEILARFLHERQILAGLTHPNIARLLEGGATEDGLPYFAMEFVDGEPITSWCERNGSGLDDRLRLFAQTCRAVQYAHRNLVVHRDLKPSNILVTPTGDVKLLDFGIAKVLSSEVGAQEWTVGRPMTPGYAAPEQLEGRPVTTATDVYALGVVLYELLSGARLHGRRISSLEEARRAVLEETPEPPSVAARGGGTPERPPVPWRSKLKGDLDHIVMQALRKEPEERYASADAFLADLERYLVGLPVQASGVGLGYRTRKFVARNRVALGATALVMLSLTGGLFTTARERDRARLEARKAGEIKDFTISLFDLADPYSEKPGNVDVRALLDRGATRARTELGKTPEVQAEMLEVLGKVYGQLAAYGPAESLLTSAFEIRRLHLGARNAAVASSMGELGSLYLKMGQDSVAENFMRRALQVQEHLHNSESREVASATGDLAAVLAALGRFAEAESLYRVALATDERAIGPESAETATDLNNLGILLLSAGRPQEALPMLERALAIRRRRLGHDHIMAAITGEGYAECLAATGRLEEARELYRWVLQVRRSRLGPKHPDLAPTVDHLALVARELGDFSTAESLFVEALDLRRAGLGPDHPDVAISLNNLATFYYRVRDLDRAASYFQQAHAHWSRTVGEDHPYALTSFNNLASVWREQGLYAESERLFREVLAKRVAQFGGDGAGVAPTYHQYGTLLRLTADYAGSERLLRRALAIYREHLGSQSVEVVGATESLARTLREVRRFAESESLLRGAVASCRKIYQRSAPQTADVLVGLGRVVLAEGRAREAEPLLREALAVRIKMLRPGDSRIAETQAALGCCLVALGKGTEARPLLTPSVAILRRQPGRVDPLAGQGEQALARIAMLAKRS